MHGIVDGSASISIGTELAVAEHREEQDSEVLVSRGITVVRKGDGEGSVHQLVVLAALGLEIGFDTDREPEEAQRHGQ